MEKRYYVIRQDDNGNQFFFGPYNTKEEAEKQRELLEKHNKDHKQTFWVCEK